MMIDIDGNIGQQMKAIRRNLKLTLKEVAAGIGVSATLLSYYENNRRQQGIDVLREFLAFCRRKKNPPDSD